MTNPYAVSARKITRIDFLSTNEENTGEGLLSWKVGKTGVVAIEQHTAQGEGDKWYFDVIFDDGTAERIFNPNRVFLSAPTISE